jgi:hypothetical protein
VSALYLYALVDGEAGAPEGVRLVPHGPLAAAVRAVVEAPTVDEAALRAHDAVVRKLSRVSRSVLPARFGTTLVDEAALAGWLATNRETLERALAQVAGCEQMTLRVHEAQHQENDNTARDQGAAGPGARYLAERLRAHRAARSVPEIDPLRPSLAHLVVAERAERHPPRAGAPVASVYHLIRRGDAAAYREIVGKFKDLCITSSGPWAPYAFAPEELS